MLLRNSILFELIVQRGVVPTSAVMVAWNSCPSLSKILEMWLHSSAICNSISETSVICPAKENSACPPKSLQKPLIGCFSILAWHKLRSHLEVGRRDAEQKPGHRPRFRPRWRPRQQWRPPTLGEIDKKREEVRKLEEVRWSPGSSPTRQWAHMAVEAGSPERARKKPQPTVGGKAPCKEFLKAGMLKKPWKYWPGIVTLGKICQFQNTEFLICKCPFSHLTCKISQKVGKYDLHFQVCMVLALQEAAEYYLTGLLEDTNLHTIHMKCVTTMPKDIQITCHICGEHLQY